MPALGLVRGRQRLEVLPAGMQALVGNDHVGAGRAPDRAPPTGRPDPRRPPARRRRSPLRRAAGASAGGRGDGLRSARPCRPRPWSGRRAGWAGRRPSPGSRSRRPCRRTARAAHPNGPGARRRCRRQPGRRRWSRRSAPRSRPRRSGGGPARRPAACSGCFRRMADGLQWPPREERHEEISRHLHRPDHALHGRRQEGRRSGAEDAWSISRSRRASTA